MEFRRVGASGLRISEIVFGNWLTLDGQIDQDAQVDCIRAALDSGITTYDTADIYSGGLAEQVLGRALKGVRRSSVEIATKVCLPVGTGPNDKGLSRKHIMESCNNSLRRLGTDYVDLYQAHRFDADTPLEESMKAFADLVRQGKVLYVGVSEWTAEQIERGHTLATEMGVPLISNQPQYSILWRVIEAEVNPTSRRLGMGQIVFSPVAQGVLTGKYQPGGSAPEGSRATDARGTRFVGRYMSDTVLERVQRLRPLAEEASLTMAQLAVAWVLQNPGVAGAIIGASRPEQVAENTAAAGVRLPADLLKRIDDTLDDLIERDPAKTADLFNVMPTWRR
ncbi:aldo/keto reductase family protein [Actinomadura barringtoniae]|uniref:Aldo/keto reductase family protein n=1 Tax=Actinomadura barringtoniae TaxID=1427535 RepID=A0A939PE68_9ACTN|nr:aldo/keto reductase family protein [Actinomadura barringtoniae]MBO2451197.1 aldo/keto reductase family protein [Actinomadura barringtoniae]